MAVGQRRALVLPLDGSVASASALGAARALTRRVGGVLHVVHVTDHPVPHHRLARRLQIAPMQEDFVFHQPRGEVAGAVLDLAKSVQAWMIVLSGHGQSNDPERLAGQTALDLIQRSTLPITVIRAAMRELPGPEWRPSRMLVPLEETPLADCVIKQVFDLAREMQLDLDILHITGAKKKPPMELATFSSPRYLDHPQYDWPAWNEEFLYRFYTYLHPDARLRLFHRRGRPDAVVLRFTMENGEDFIALSWRGLLQDKVAETVRGVLARAEVPVLLIRT
ncbi:MAG: universal stress protein [Actinomycetota bacterium]